MTDQTNPEQVQAVDESSKNEAQTTVEAETFDKDRALATINKLREFEKEARQLRKWKETHEEEERKRTDAELSENERLKKQLAEKENALKLIEHKELQREIAVKVGLPINLANRLQGETEEELEADAIILQEQLSIKPAEQSKPKVNPTNPGESITGQGETAEQRKARLHGTSVDIFDPTFVVKKGGGVYTTENIEK